MFLTQKCQYALRAIFELAKRHGEDPVKISQIADAQAIPPRFLEVILSQLKQAGFVESRRGSEGGYRLARSPRSITLGEVIRFVEGPLTPVKCVSGATKGPCPLHDDCVFLPVWEKARKAVAGVYDHTTFQDLIDAEARMRHDYVPSYSI